MGTALTVAGNNFEIPEDNSITFEVRGKGTAGTAYFARRDAEKGMTKCLKNYFDAPGSDNFGGFVRECAAHDECAVHVTPYNDPLEDTIIEKLIVEKLGCNKGNGSCGFNGNVKFEYLSIKSPDEVGGHGCRLPPGFEHSQKLKNRLCSGDCKEGCTDKSCGWCRGLGWY